MGRIGTSVLCILVFSFAAPVSGDDSAGAEEAPCPKCETPRILREYFTGARKPAARMDELHASIVSEQGHFRVHYDTTGYNAPDMTDEDGNGVPDYVDSTLVYLEYAWDLEVNRLGYDPPREDDGEGGGGEIDCYIKNYGTAGGYGATQPVSTPDGYTAYITIDNNYAEKQYHSKGYKGLRVTTAHEFFHVIHFNYFFDYGVSWWMEQSAVWMEEKAWDDVNDYLNYLEYFFLDTMRNKSPLDSNYGNFKYGAALWPMYLGKRFGDDIIKSIWDALAASDRHTIGVFDEVIPGGLAKAYNEFAVWNYFTKDRANTVDFHSDSDRFEYMVPVDWRANFSPSSNDFAANHLTTRYIEILFVGEFDGHDALWVRAAPEGGGSFAASLVFYNGPYDYEIRNVASEGSAVPLARKWEKAVLVVSCTSTSGNDYAFTVDTEISIGTGVSTGAIPAITAGGAYPNPFNPATTLRFTVPEPGHVTVSVFSVNGQKVADLIDGELSAGEKRVVWKPEGLAGGLYLVHITTPAGTKTVKATFAR